MTFTEIREKNPGQLTFKAGELDTSFGYSNSVTYATDRRNGNSELNSSVGYNVGYEPYYSLYEAPKAKIGNGNELSAYSVEPKGLPADEPHTRASEVRALELAANEILTADGFNTYFNPETPAIDSKIVADSRVSADEVNARALSASFRVSYLYAVTLLEGLETAEGRALAAAAKADRVAKTRKALGANFVAKRSASRAEAKALKAAKRRQELGKLLPKDYDLLGLERA